MRKSPQPTSPGMTLMETVIAIGIIGFAIPLLMAATAASMGDKRNAEADTRAAWIARDVQNQISSVWATPRRQSDFPTSVSLSFPTFGSENSPNVFLYDNEGRFVAQGSAAEIQTGSTVNGAQYLVGVFSRETTPINLTSSSTKLARLYIKVEYPAKAPKTKRQVLQFSVVTPQQPPF